jgi:serine protease inhibitor
MGRDELFHPSFLQRTGRYYHAEIDRLNFESPEALARINGWVSRETKGKIPQILRPADVTPATTLVLLNAIYFKGAWTKSFDARETRPGTFRLADGREKQVPTMARTDEFRFLRGEGFRGVELAYASGRFSMYVLVPDEQISLAKLESQLSMENWARWLRTSEVARHTIRIPRFKLDYETELKEPLSTLGMEVAFGSGADFSEMLPSSPGISKVRHKTFVEVNEEGTEAAASTAVNMARGGRAFSANRPFLCVIRESRTGEMLFLGAVQDPI